METEYKDQPGQKGKEVTVEKSIADFFDKLAEKLGQTNAAPKPNTGDDKRFQVYSDAFQGFAQNNVSKSEGFSIGVKAHKDYAAITEQLVTEFKKKAAARAAGYPEADIKMV